MLLCAELLAAMDELTDLIALTDWLQVYTLNKERTWQTNLEQLLGDATGGAQRHGGQRTHDDDL
jgi:hypothetical protein